MAAPAPEITALLTALQSGDRAAMNRLVPLVYDELRRLARRHMAGQRQGHTLQTADLVNEAYLKLANGGGWKDRVHFFAVAASAMRSVLVDYARRRGYLKRGANAVRVSLSEADADGRAEETTAEIVEVDQVLGRLAALDPRKAQIVELRYFGGLGVDEIAALLDLSPRTIKREWRWARAWLYRELGEKAPP